MPPTLPASLPAIVSTQHRGLATRFFAPIFRRITCGTLTVTLPGGTRLTGVGAEDAGGPEAQIVIHRWRALRRLILGGDVGFAEAYIDGDWSSPTLTSLIELAARNMTAIPGAERASLPWRLAHRLRHALRANTLSGSRRNIVAHYDLGNDFYARWLDPGMQYSSALFGPQTATLEEAQRSKLDRIEGLLAARPGDEVLEIGFGWGAVAEHLARAGCRVTALTLSPSQHRYATRRLESAGVAPSADLRIQDYRAVEGRFDRIVSIEMLEAVGEAWWPTYFERLKSLLRPGGVILLQCITIADERFANYRRNPDFIQRHVFPGGMLPSPSAMRAAVERAGLAVAETQSFGDSYAETLAHWQQRFQAAWPDIARSGFTPRFKRLWEYYLSYCEAGFRAKAIDVMFWRLEHA